MLTKILSRGKPAELSKLEESNTVKMRNLLIQTRSDMDNISDLQVASYVFFKDNRINFGRVDGKNVIFKTHVVVMTAIEIKEKLKFLASAMGKLTQCDYFSNLAELVLNTGTDDENYDGFVFFPFEERERFKLIEVITKIVLKTRTIDKIEIDGLSIYRTVSGITKYMLWDTRDVNGLCVCLNFDYTNTFSEINHIEQLYTLDRRTLFLPLDPPNKFKSYGYGKYEIGSNKYEATIKLANLLKNPQTPSDYSEGWKFISQLINEFYGVITLSGIKSFLRCSDQEALETITKFISGRSNVEKNANETYSAWDALHTIENIYEWKIVENNFVCDVSSLTDHNGDEALSVASSRPVSPPPPDLASHFQLITKIDRILDLY